MAGSLIGGGRPISWRLAGFVAVLVLFVSNSRLKAIFGRGEIATDVPLLLFGLILFATWRINGRAAKANTRFRSRKSAITTSASSPGCSIRHRSAVSMAF